MIIGITGTPGTGKTTLCKELHKNGFDVIFLIDFIKMLNNNKTYDYKNKCIIIDINKLKSRLKKYILKIKNQLKKNVLIIDSHMSHLFCTHSIILRTRPDILENRLNKRNYSAIKKKENINAEALDVILCDAYNNYKNIKNIFEIDTTYINLVDLKKKCIYIINLLKNNKFKRENDIFIPGQINWIEYAS